MMKSSTMEPDQEQPHQTDDVQTENTSQQKRTLEKLDNNGPIQNQPPSTQTCPYLDTVNRSLLDFDFDFSCCISLQSGPHIYGCLVCGNFFLGRGQHTPAYIHSVDENHSVFVHLSKGTFHCLPDDYEIRDPSLSDISAALHPVFNGDEIRQLDSQRGLARDLFGKRYLPGFVGLNNLKKTDYVNATVQALAHVRPLRDFFLRLGRRNYNGGLSVTEDYDDGIGMALRKKKSKRHRSAVVDEEQFSHLALCFGELMRKMWSDKRFKSNVDPHMMIQAVSVASKKRFHIGKQAEAGEFIAWLLHHLHVGIGGTRKPGSSIIHEIFQGKVEVVTRKRVRKKDLMKDATEEGEEDDRIGSDNEEDHKAQMQERERQKADVEKFVIDETSASINFLQLTLDIPEKPLFKDADGGLVIPQEPLVSVLKKFNGVSFSDALAKGGIPEKRRYRLKQLPNYLILHLARFQKNNFYTEKNPTIVAFPVKNLDLTHYVFPEEKVPTEDEVREMSVKELKKLLNNHGFSHLAKTAIEKSELLQHCIDFITTTLPKLLTQKYDLVANITHDSPAEVGREGRRDPLEEGSYRCHVQHRATGQWYEMQDLHVQETMPQLIGLSESYVLIFEKKGLS